MKRIFFIITLIMLACIPAFSQDLEMIGKEKAFSINGGVSLNQVGYYSTDSISRRDPYNYFLSGNLNLGLYGWNVPLSFSYSNQKVTYTQPFNQYSMHPTYKWVRMHIGYTSMSFSPYTLNGHLFLGGGVELTPTKSPFSLSAMYGRLRRAVETDTTAANPVPPEFERWGYGLKGSYIVPTGNVVKAKIGITFFHASDKPGSLDYIPDSTVYPGENIVLSTHFDIKVKGGFSISGELASSAVTENTESEMERGDVGGWNRFMGNMADPNATTQVYSAKRFNLNYGAGIYSIGVGYERIDPGYETYGAYYFNSDMENITLNGTLGLFENKVNLAANVGRQHDNLDDSKASEFDRWVTAFNVGYTSGSKLTANVSWSTFTSFMNIRSEFDYINQVTPYDNYDTLDYTQLSSSANANVSYILQNSERIRQNLSLNFSQQNASEKQSDTRVEGGSRFYNTNSSYSYSLVPVQLTLSAAMNAGLNKAQETNSLTIGPSLSVSKMLLDKKLRATLAFSYNKAYSNGLVQSRVTSLRSNTSYRLGKRHNFSLGISFMNRKTNIQDDPRVISELVGTLGYSMSF